MITKEQQQAFASQQEASERVESNAEADHWTEILRRARGLHKRAEQAGVPSSLVAALVVADAIEGLGDEIKKAAKK